MYVIAATYGHGRCLFYAGPADAESASRAGVHTFSLSPADATTFARWPDAMRASWRASPPRRRPYQQNVNDGLLVSCLPVQEFQSFQQCIGVASGQFPFWVRIELFPGSIRARQVPRPSL